MSVEQFIASKITKSERNNAISKPIIKIGIVGISIGVAVMLITVAIVAGFKNEIITKITGLTTHLTIKSTSLNASNEPYPISISKDSILIIKKNTALKHIQAVAFKNGILKTELENEGVLMKGVGTDFDFNYINSKIVKGNPLQLNDTATVNDLLISKSLADRLELKLNQKILIYFISQHLVYDSTLKQDVIKYEQRSRRLTICGIFDSGFSDFDNNLAFCDIKHIQKINYWAPEQVAAYEIKLNNFNEEDTTLSKVQDLLGYNYSVKSVRELYSNIFTWLDKLDVNGVIIVVLIIIVATINMITALLILILERSNMIGLLKSLGMANVNVRKIFVLISLKLIGKGMLYGNLIGLMLYFIQHNYKLIKLDSSTYYIEFVATKLNWQWIAALNLGTFVVCFIMLIIPTGLVSKLTPIKTLKFD
ncbi:MAG: ABC transporter permease [Bacteroidetes bacterium]|nr:ABC transporter permease [Bacteroidota bacterium]